MRDLGPSLAYRLDSAVVTDATALRVEGGELVITKPVFGGSAMGAAVLGSLYGINVGAPFWGGAGMLVLAALVCATSLPPPRRRAAVETPELFPVLPMREGEAV